MNCHPQTARIGPQTVGGTQDRQNIRSRALRTTRRLTTRTSITATCAPTTSESTTLRDEMLE
jgi:hypothetical protein